MSGIERIETANDDDGSVVAAMGAYLRENRRLRRFEDRRAARRLRIKLAAIKAKERK
jgi:hypothetical protein